jgi:hypothetical protein
MISTQIQFVMRCFPLFLTMFCFSSCFVTKDFSKVYNLDKSLEFTDLEVNRNFEVNAVYNLVLKDGREFGFKVKEITQSSLLGYITNTKNKSNKSEENFLEIPFERIEGAGKVFYDPWLTFLIFGGPPLLGVISILTY